MSEGGPKNVTLGPPMDPKPMNTTESRPELVPNTSLGCGTEGSRVPEDVVVALEHWIQVQVHF